MTTEPVSYPSWMSKLSPPEPGKVHDLEGYSELFARFTMEAKHRALPLKIVGFLFLNGNPGIEQVRERLAPKFLKFMPFRSVIQHVNKQVKFVEMDEKDIDLSYHCPVVTDTLSLDAVDELGGDLYEQALDQNRPLWKLILIERLENGQSALVMTLDHTIGDGATMVDLLKRVIVDDPVEGNVLRKTSSAVTREQTPYPLTSRVYAFFTGICRVLLGTVLPADMQTSLKVKDCRNPDKKKSLAFTEDIDFNKIVAIRRKFPNTTVNDILLSLMTMTLRAYYEETKDPIMATKQSMRGNFPYNMRAPGTDILVDSFGNDIATCTFNFPLHYTSMDDLVANVKAEVDLIKHSPAPYLNTVLTRIVSKYMPTNLMIDTLLDANGKVTAMLSNVPGPASEVSVLGEVVENIRFHGFVPLGLYIGVLTYNNKLNACVNLCKECGDAKDLAKHWIPSFNKLYEHAMSK